jgi:glutamine cyclotransferase
MLEGWGMTHDSEYIYTTDGSAYIYTIDPKTFKVISKVEVKDTTGNKITYLNEIELVGDYIYANKFLT